MANTNCNSCNYCKNLKMTEYNVFCFSRTFNDENSFQQPRWRAFNKVVGEVRYKEILNLVTKIIPNSGKLTLTNFWKSITQEQWEQLLSIPEAANFKEGFEYISGCKIEASKPSLSGKEVSVTIDGITYAAVIK